MAEKSLEIGSIFITLETLNFTDDGKVLWKPEKIELNVDGEMQIDERNVDGELAKMAQYISYYGDIAAQLKAQLARKEEEKEAFEALADQNIRKIYSEKCQNDPKQKMPTETNIKRIITVSPEYQELAMNKISMQSDYYRVDNIVRAFLKKADSLIALSYNQRQERKVY